MNIQLRRILCPIDFSEPALLALSYAEALAESFGAELHILHVLEMVYPSGPGEVLGAAPLATTLDTTSCQRALNELVERRPAGRLRARTQVVIGRPFADIVRVAGEDAVDLVVMGTHGRGWFSHLLIGSVAEKVVRTAPCPVLTVKPGEHEFVAP